MISLSLSLSLSRIRFSFLRLRRNSCQVINIPLLMLLRSRPYFMWFEDVPVPNDPSVFLASQRPGTFYFRLSTVRLHATRHPLSPGSALSLFSRTAHERPRPPFALQLDPRRLVLHYVGTPENADERDIIDRGGSIIRTFSIPYLRGGVLRYRGVTYSSIDALIEAHADTLQTPIDRSFYTRYTFGERAQVALNRCSAHTAPRRVVVGSTRSPCLEIKPPRGYSSCRLARSSSFACSKARVLFPSCVCCARHRAPARRSRTSWCSSATTNTS